MKNFLEFFLKFSFVLATQTNSKRGEDVSQIIITTIANVNLGMKGAEIIAQVISFLTWPFCMRSKALLFLLFP